MPGGSLKKKHFHKMYGLKINGKPGICDQVTFSVFLSRQSNRLRFGETVTII